MKVDIMSSIAHTGQVSIPRTPSTREQVIRYYEEAGPDYETWSRNYNMHFGFYRKGMNPLNREAMLEQLNREVCSRLDIPDHKPFSVADLGCGLGASLRHISKRFPKVRVTGVTVVPWQVEQATSINSKNKITSKIEIIESDYCRTPFADNSLDAVYAIESSCYATGASKADLLNEIHRILKPGGRFVISDGFLKKDVGKSGCINSVYKQLCRSWALTELGNIKDVESHLRRLNFSDIKTEDVSLHVAPSVAHVPFTVIYFLIKELMFGKARMTRERWDNLISPLLTMVLGSAQKYFGYFLVSGKKSE